MFVLAWFYTIFTPVFIFPACSAGSAGKGKMHLFGAVCGVFLRVWSDDCGFQFFSEGSPCDGVVAWTEIIGVFQCIRSETPVVAHWNRKRCYFFDFLMFSSLEGPCLCERNSWYDPFSSSQPELREDVAGKWCKLIQTVTAGGRGGLAAHRE